MSLLGFHFLLFFFGGLSHPIIELPHFFLSFQPCKKEKEKLSIICTCRRYQGQRVLFKLHWPPFGRTPRKRDCPTHCETYTPDRLPWPSSIHALHLRNLYPCQQRGLRKTRMLPTRFRQNLSPLSVACSHAHRDYARDYLRSLLPLEGRGCRSSGYPGTRR